MARRKRKRRPSERGRRLEDARNNRAATLPNHLAIDTVRRGGRTRTRNEQMANFLLERGFMEKRGRGYPVMRQAMREFNDTEPELMEDRAGRFFTVTFRGTEPSGW